MQYCTVLTAAERCVVFSGADVGGGRAGLLSIHRRGAVFRAPSRPTSIAVYTAFCSPHCRYCCACPCVQGACRAILALLAHPEADSPLNCDAGEAPLSSPRSFFGRSANVGRTALGADFPMASKVMDPSVSRLLTCERICPRWALQYIPLLLSFWCKVRVQYCRNT